MNRKAIIPHLIASFTFLVGGILFIKDGYWFIGYFSIAVSAANFSAIRMLRKYPTFYPIFLTLLDLVTALIYAIVLIRSGKQYLQYAWFLVVLMCVFAIAIKLKKAFLK